MKTILTIFYAIVIILNIGMCIAKIADHQYTQAIDKATIAILFGSIMLRDYDL